MTDTVEFTIKCLELIADNPANILTKSSRGLIRARVLANKLVIKNKVFIEELFKSNIKTIELLLTNPANTLSTTSVDLLDSVKLSNETCLKVTID